MSRHSARGTAWEALRRRVLTEESGICWLCGHGGATTVDHIVPASVDPSLRWERSNLRAAHARCNRQRGAGGSRPQPRTTRAWLSLSLIHI